MKSKEETTTIVQTAITDLEIAINQGNRKAIIMAMNSVEYDPEIDLEIIDNDLFESWEETTEEAHTVLYS